ncbi:MAG: hypothetical protein L0Y64_15845 [Myxococcaceae bacterium]|nr:hypothetical protein [Myxococcaceae bacterium]
MPASHRPGADAEPRPFHVFPKALLCIEWTRSAQRSPGEYLKGRYYLDTDERELTPHAEAVRNLMDFLLRRVRTTYPTKSKDRSPIYVGRDLSSLLDVGAARLVYASGQPVELVPN